MIRTISWAPLVLAVVLTGCSQDTPDSALTDDGFLDEMLDDLESPGTHPSGRSVTTVSGTRPAAAPEVAHAEGQRLELRLQPGDRFPLIKTVEQTLVQKSETAPLTARTRLELTLALSVDAVEADSILFSVRYSRVAYSHDLGGQRLEFDSERHQAAVPQDAIPYAGMVDNGFSFRIGRDNRIQELIGYQAFLERCVEQIPADRRETLLTEIGQRFGDDGVANFIDDTIGLLPYNSDVDPDQATSVLPGDVWTRERRMMQPVPVHLVSTYRLTELNADTAEIDITGRIAAGAGIETQTGGLTIRGGHAVGHCTVDRDTGLPLELSVTQLMALAVTTPTGETIDQEKQVVTTIRTFPEMRGPVVQRGETDTNVQPAGMTSSANSKDDGVRAIPREVPTDARPRRIGN